jgi:hypothetical protein
VVSSIIFLMEFLNTNITIHVDIEGFKSFLNKVLSELTHFTDDHS